MLVTVVTVFSGFLPSGLGPSITARFSRKCTSKKRPRSGPCSVLSCLIFGLYKARRWKTRRWLQRQTLGKYEGIPTNRAARHFSEGKVRLANDFIAKRPRTHARTTCLIGAENLHEQRPIACQLKRWQNAYQDIFILRPVTKSRLRCRSRPKKSSLR